MMTDFRPKRTTGQEMKNGRFPMKAAIHVSSEQGVIQNSTQSKPFAG